MDIPKQLIILDTTWKIVFKKRIGRGGILGLCDPTRHEIVLLKGLNQNDLLSTLIHEVLHCLEYSLQKSMGHALINKIEAPLASVFIQLIDAHKGN